MEEAILGVIRSKHDRVTCKRPCSGGRGLGILGLWHMSLCGIGLRAPSLTGFARLGRCKRG